MLVEGARQVGKSTLVEEIARHEHVATIVTLDDPATRNTALNDPVGFIADLAKPLCIDEVQRAPGLLIAIKLDVDRHHDPGRYLLTGSANVVASRRVIDALTGRIETIRLGQRSARTD